MGKVAIDGLKPSGIDTILHLNDGDMVIERTADAQPILDEIKAIKYVTEGKSKSGDLYHVARIPKMVIEKYCKDCGITFHDFCVDDAHITKILNDPEYSSLRIWEGRA